MKTIAPIIAILGLAALAVADVAPDPNAVLGTVRVATMPNCTGSVIVTAIPNVTGSVAITALPTGTNYVSLIGNVGSGHTNAALSATTLLALGNHPCWKVSIFNSATSQLDGVKGPGTLYVYQDGFPYPVNTREEKVFSGITNSIQLSVSNLEAWTIPYRWEPAQ